MVLATRIAAIIFAVPSITTEDKEDFATVSRYTKGEIFRMRLGESLGVRLDLVAESLRDNGQIETSEYNDVNRAIIFGGGTVSTHLPLAEGIAVRKGELDHFDLRIDANSKPGIALAKAFRIKGLSDDDGNMKRLTRLQEELSSQTSVPAGGCPSCSWHVPVGVAVCPCCKTPVPAGFEYTSHP
ncbi:unnamed protein product [Ectocarpus fasciculatus]